MKIRKEIVFLIIVILTVFFIRLFFSYMTTTYSHDDAYRYKSQSESIDMTGKPDDMRNNFSEIMIFYSVWGMSSFFSYSIIYKVIFGLISALSIFFVYLLAYDITSDRKSALFGSIFAAFIPVSYLLFTNSADPLIFAIPLTLLSLYVFMKIKSEFQTYLFIFLMMLYSFIHPSVLIIVIALVIYMILYRIEGMDLQKKEMELIALVIFLVIWIQIIFSKNFLMFHGSSIIWQNIPKEILNNFFADTTIYEVIYKLGFLLFLIGVYFIYDYLLVEKNKNSLLLISYSITVLILLWFKLIKLNYGIVLLGFIFAIFAADFYKRYFVYMKKTRFSKFAVPVFVFIIIIFILTSIIPSLSYSYQALKDAPSEKYMISLKWIKDNTPKDSIILGSYDEGNIIESESGRKALLTSQFLLKKDIDVSFQDVRQIYTGKNKIEALKLLEKYNVNYVVISEFSKRYYTVDDIDYMRSDSYCFVPVYDTEDVKIYKVDCHVE